MTRPIILAVSGKKQSGKTSLCNFLKTYYAIKYENKKFTYNQLEDGNIEIFLDKRRLPSNFEISNDCKVFSFADPLKELCQYILDITYDQCNGTDEDKNTLTKYIWNNIPENIKKKYKEKGGYPTGQLTAREVMQIVATDIFRTYFDKNIWVNSCFKKIYQSNVKVALISDCRFKSEVENIIENKGYIIRLSRIADGDCHESEKDLDSFDWNSYEDNILYLNNSSLSMVEKNNLAIKFLDKVVLSGKKNINN